MDATFPSAPPILIPKSLTGPGTGIFSYVGPKSGHPPVLVPKSLSPASTSALGAQGNLWMAPGPASPPTNSAFVNLLSGDTPGIISYQRSNSGCISVRLAHSLSQSDQGTSGDQGNVLVRPVPSSPPPKAKSRPGFKPPPPPLPADCLVKTLMPSPCVTNVTFVVKQAPSTSSSNVANGAHSTSLSAIRTLPWPKRPSMVPAYGLSGRPLPVTLLPPPPKT